jgi:hypothetical protein
MRYVLSVAVLSCLWAQQDAATRALLLKYDAKFWHLNLEVSHLTTTLKGYVRTLIEVTAPALDTLAFELHSALTVDSVRDAYPALLCAYLVALQTNPNR